MYLYLFQITFATREKMETEQCADLPIFIQNAAKSLIFVTKMFNDAVCIYLITVKMFRIHPLFFL